MSSRLSQAMTKGEAPRQISPFERFRGHLSLVRGDLVGLVGQQNVDKFVRVCLNAAQANPKVLGGHKHTKKSLLLACMKAAQDSLLPDGREAVFNVYSTKIKNDEGREEWVDTVQYLPMAYGLIQKIYEAGATFVDAVPVYEKDTFDYQRGDEPKIVHKPYAGTDEPGEVIAAYCIVKLKTGEVKREVMWRREIERVRQKSKAKEGLMWKEFYDQAAVKSVIHRIVKQLPRAESLERTLRHDNEATGIEEITNIPAEATGTDLEELIEKKIEPIVSQQAQAEKNDTPTPKQGDAGTPEMKTKFLGQMDACTSEETLDIVMDDVRFYKWLDGDEKELKAHWAARREAINNPPPKK